MSKILALISFIALSILFAAEPVNAQGAYYSQAQYSGYRTATKNTYSKLPKAGFRRLATVNGRSGRNGLPPTRLDSFVKNAGSYAFQIYGDEGGYNQTILPPIQEFTQENRINTGIRGVRNQGLTTGHSSHLPAAWGNDEYIGGSEYTMSGTRGSYQQYPQRYNVSSNSYRPQETNFSPRFGFRFN